MDTATLEELFGDPEKYRWVPLSALKAGEFLSCIDGRHADCVVSAPGGDLGEFVVLLGAVEKVTGVKLGKETVERCIKEVMDWHSRFYMHSDEIALQAMSEAITADPRFDGADGLDDISRLADFIRRPPHHYRSALEEYLVNPEYTGCGHLRLMLERPQDYEVRQALVRNCILAFYHRMWSGSPSPHFVVLTGVHEEAAVLVIELPGDADDSTYVPAIRSGPIAKNRAFVVHEPARHFLRRENLNVLTNAAAIDPLVDVAAVQEEMNSSAQRQLLETSRRLADGLPVFAIDFDSNTHELTIKPL